MTHFNGSQEQDLLQTATFIINNQSGFSAPIIRWSEAFVNGGIANPTYSTLLAREDITVTPTVSGTDLVIIQESQEIDAIDTTQNQQLVALGESSVEISESLALIQQQLQAAINANREFASEVNTRLSEDVTELGKSLQQQANDDAFGGVSTFFGGLGVGSLAVLAVIAVLVFRRGL